MNNHDNNFIGLSLRQEEDGKGVIRHSNVKEVGDYTAEFKIPLSSGDAYEIDLKPGAGAI